MSADLEKLVNDGDNDAWEKLVSETQSRLYGYLLYNVPTSDDAQDLLVDVYREALRLISSLDNRGDRGELQSWLHAIARRKVADFWHQAKPVGKLSDSLEDTSNDISLEFREAIAMLPEQTRRALFVSVKAKQVFSTR